MIETNFVAYLKTLQAGLRVFYLHLESKPPDKFIFFVRAGDERLDTIDDDGEPDIIYFDVEVWASTLDDLVTLDTLLRATSDYRGAFGTGRVEDIRVEDQRDDYEPLANADTLPEFSSAFRVTITGYE